MATYLGKTFMRLCVMCHPGVKQENVSNHVNCYQRELNLSRVQHK